jgi:hypothetical protein
LKGKCQNCGAIGHKGKGCKLKKTKMAARTEKITKNFRKIRVTALIALIVVDQVILRAIVSN